MKLSKFVALGALGGDSIGSLTLSFATLADGALPYFSGATWAISSGKAVNTPTEVASLLTDGGLENWGSATNLTSWTELITAGSTINREATVIHGGTYALRGDIDAGNPYCNFNQAVTLAVDAWARITFWGRSSVNAKAIRSTLGAGLGASRTLSDSAWTQYTDTMQALVANPTCGVSRQAVASASYYADDLEAFSLSTAALFAALNGSVNGAGYIKAGWNILTGNPAGVLGWWDGVAPQQNCIVGWCDGVSAGLVKYVGATKTIVIAATAITYVAGGIVEIRRASETNTFSLWYNGTQVGTGQTIADAEIINNKRFGMFSTNAGNAAITFSVLPFGYSLQRFTLLGDSISDNTSLAEWPAYYYAGRGGLISVTNRAHSGDTIVTHLDGQVTAAAADNANVIIIELGTNDNEAGDMVALQAEVEENLAELAESNPNATIYYLNILPRWTNVGGGTVVTSTNKRAAIAAACLAQGVTCWDTFTDPWITAADTSDGLHPNAAGSAKVAAQVLARVS